MKKLLLIIVMCLCLSGCTFLNIEDVENTVPPANNKPAIEGKWTITKLILPEDGSVDNFAQMDLIGQDVIFSSKAVIIENLYSNSPRFVMRRVNADRYFKNEFYVDKTKLGIERDNIIVIDIYNDEDYFLKILKENEEQAFIVVNNAFIQINRISETVTNEEIESFIKNQRSEILEDVGSRTYSENGLLLGLKEAYLSPDNNLPNWIYSTVYIKFKDSDVDSFNVYDGLVVPRKGSFNILTEQRGENDIGIKDVIKISPSVSLGEEDHREPTNPITLASENTLKNIKFLSQDYLNIENIDVKNNKRELKLYLIEPSKLSSPVKLSDLTQDGKKIFDDTAKFNFPMEDDLVFDESNIGLTRDLGYWRFIGRANFSILEDQMFKVFDINTLLPTDIVKYDNLSLPISEIKEKFPDIRQVFTSPNNRFLITMENNVLNIYNIENGVILDNAIYRFEMANQAETIMTEWATGNNAGSWERAFENLIN